MIWRQSPGSPTHASEHVGGADMTNPAEYRASVTCRRCGSVRWISKLAEPFRHWFCGRADTGLYCGTPNVVDASAWSTVIWS